MPAMIRRTPLTMLIWLLAIAMLPVRIANAHLHMCLDGQEAPIALHVQDEAGHHDDEHEAGHEDRDIRVSGPALLAKAGLVDKATPHFAPLSAIDAILLPAPGRVDAAVPRSTTPSAAIFDLRPPSRAPPR